MEDSTLEMSHCFQWATEAALLRDSSQTKQIDELFSAKETVWIPFIIVIVTLLSVELNDNRYFVINYFVFPIKLVL